MKVSEVLEDIEEENEVEDEEQRQEEVRGRLEQVQLSTNTSCSTVPLLDGVEKKGEDLSESSQDKDEDTGEPPYMLTVICLVSCSCFTFM